MADEAVYPTSIAVLSDKIDEVDDIQAGHVNRLQNEIIALQTYVGTNPHGSLTNFSDRVSVCFATDGGLQRGAVLPGTGNEVAGQMFYHTDTQQFFIYDGVNWDIMGPGGVSIQTAFSFTSASISPSVPLDMNKIFKVIFKFSGTSGASGGNIFLRTQNGSTHSSSYESLQMFNLSGTLSASSNISSPLGIRVGGHKLESGGSKDFCSGNMVIDTHQDWNTSSDGSRCGFVNGQSFGQQNASVFGQNYFSGSVNKTAFTTLHFWTDGGTMEGSVFIYSHVLTL